MADYQIDHGTHNNETGRPDYTEYVFNLPKEQLAYVQIDIEGWDYATYQKGNWAIQLKEPRALPTKPLRDTEIVIGTQAISLTNIVLSPFSLAFDYLPKELQTQSVTIDILSKNNEHKELIIEDHSRENRTREGDHYVYEFGYLELEDVEKVLINGQEVPF